MSEDLKDIAREVHAILYSKRKDEQQNIIRTYYDTNASELINLLTDNFLAFSQGFFCSFRGTNHFCKRPGRNNPPISFHGHYIHLRYCRNIFDNRFNSC